MPPSCPVLQDVTTINYTLEWPQLEKPSNTTFAGTPQIDICRCGSLNKHDVGHVYERYRCSRPEIRFSTPDEELWVLQAPLGQVNLLRPANNDEIQRRREIHATAEPSAYKGKNILLLSGPCPRGRYQALATLQYLKSLPPLARQNINSLSLLIQPYEEDCSPSACGRAYLDLTHYIIEALPNFRTLCLNIWGEEARLGAREFAIVLWREGVRIQVSWDWCGGETVGFGDVQEFWRGVEGGVVKRRLVWEERGEGGLECAAQKDGDGGDGDASIMTPIDRSRSIAQELLVRMGRQRDVVGWEEVTGLHDGSVDEAKTAGGNSDEADAASGGEEPEHLDDETSTHSDTFVDEDDDEQISAGDAATPTSAHATSDDEWSDTLLTPLSPLGGETGSWQML